MLHDRELLDRLSAYAPVKFDGNLWRATRRGLDPLAPSVRGGRWMVPDQTPTLYTSCTPEGALAEIVYYWSQLSPLPSKPVVLHRLTWKSSKTLRLARGDLVSLGVVWERFGETNYSLTQKIGAAAAYLEFDGLIAPSARWNGENLMLFLANHVPAAGALESSESKEVDWQAWSREHAGNARE